MMIANHIKMSNQGQREKSQVFTVPRHPSAIPLPPIQTKPWRLSPNHNYICTPPSHSPPQAYIAQKALTPPYHESIPYHTFNHTHTPDRKPRLHQPYLPATTTNQPTTTTTSTPTPRRTQNATGPQLPKQLTKDPIEASTKDPSN